MLNISYYNAMRLAVPVALAALLAVPSAAREAAKGDSLALKGGRAKGRVWLTPGQALRGQTRGVYVAEPSAEPGTRRAMLLRGVTAPVASFYDLSRSQPAVYINGVPVLDDNQLFFGGQKGRAVPLGSAMNVLASVDMSHVRSMEVVTDPLRLALLGPIAANGAIMIETRDRFAGSRHVTGGAGIVCCAKNGTLACEDDGETRLGYNVHASIGTSQSLANYLFTVSATRDAAPTPATAYNKYNVGFFLTLVPFKGLTVNSRIQAAMSGRTRNQSWEERFAEMGYVPTNLPNVGLETYAPSQAKDDNDDMRMHGNLTLRYKSGGFHASAGVYFDYTTNNRAVFWPSAMMENVSYASDFAGYNRRFYGQAEVGYDLRLSPLHLVQLAWTGTMRQDKYHYNYDRGYDGTDDKKQSTNSGGFKQYYATDQLDMRTAESVYSLSYTYSDLVTVRALVRQDATSCLNRDHRWQLSPAASADWHILRTFRPGKRGGDDLSLALSYARLGKLLDTDIYSRGPRYVGGDATYTYGPAITTYTGLATLTRPYLSGWSGYGYRWPRTEKMEARLKGSFLTGRLTWQIAAYRNRDTDIIQEAAASETSGYESRLTQDLEIENRGVEATVAATPWLTRDWRLDLALNISHNHNDSQWADYVPEVVGGLNATLRYKRFDLGLDFYGLDRAKALTWEKPSFVKLRSALLGWDVPLKKQRLRLYAQADNIFGMTLPRVFAVGCEVEF